MICDHLRYIAILIAAGLNLLWASCFCMNIQIHHTTLQCGQNRCGSDLYLITVYS